MEKESKDKGRVMSQERERRVGTGKRKKVNMRGRRETIRLMEEDVWGNKGKYDGTMERENTE